MKLPGGLSPLPDTAVHLRAVAGLPAFAPPNAETSREARAAALWTIADVEMAAAELVLAKARTLLANKGWTVTTSLRAGHAAGQLLALIRKFNPDLMVIGAKGRTAAKRFVLGSVAQEVVKYARCSQLVVRPYGLGATVALFRSRRRPG